MAVTSKELARIDEELDALAPPHAIPASAIERAWAGLAETPLGDLALVDGALDALVAGLDLPSVNEVARTPRAAERSAGATRPHLPEAQEAEASARSTPPPEEDHAPGDRALLYDDRGDDAEEEAKGRASATPALASLEDTSDASFGDDLLNPFEEPANDGAGDDGATLILDMNRLGGLDESALFDGFVEEPASAPLEGGGFHDQAPSLAHPSSQSPPPIPVAARSADAADERPTDIEDLKSYLEGDEDELDLEFFVDDDVGEDVEAAEAPADAEASGDPDGGGGAPKKKGFFKKLFG